MELTKEIYSGNTIVALLTNEDDLGGPHEYGVSLLIDGEYYAIVPIQSASQALTKIELATLARRQVIAEQRSAYCEVHWQKGEVVQESVIWLSRHTPSDAQLDDIRKHLRYECQVTQYGMVFADTKANCLEQIAQLVKTTGATVLVGVFPAHVAIWLANAGYHLGMPVSVPMPAAEGEIRKYEHSHIEWVNA